MKEAYHPHDKLFKAVFKQTSLVQEMLEAKAPKKVLALLDLTTLQITDSSFVDAHLEEDFADVVLICQTKTKQPVLIPFILEHKSSLPTYPPYQVMHYQDRIWLMQVSTPKVKPTPVVPVLFFHGKEKWKVKPWEKFLAGYGKAFRRFTPFGGYNFIDLSAMTDDEIRAFRSGFLKIALLCMKHRVEEEYFLNNLPGLFNFVETDDVDEDTRRRNLITILNYLRSMKAIKTQVVKEKIQPMSKETIDELRELLEDIRREELEELTQQITQEAMQQGMQQGISFEAQNIIRSLIQHIPNASDDSIANLTSKPVELVRQVRKQMHYPNDNSPNSKD